MRIFRSYLDSFETADLKAKIPHQENSQNIMIVGRISAGKSSFINYFFNTKEDVGVGDTTPVAHCVYQYKKENGKILYIWDTPGENKGFNIKNR